MTAAVLRTDGGSRGNPGPAGAGFVIEVDGEITCRGGKFIANATNNIAEYEAFIWGLENVAALGHSEVHVYADSELLVKQINGQYRVKNEGLKPLFIELNKDSFAADFRRWNPCRCLACEWHTSASRRFRFLAKLTRRVDSSKAY